VEKEQEDGMQAKYNNLTLRMANALMNISKVIHYPTNQFEGDEELENAMKKARMGPSTSSAYEKYYRETRLMERQHHLEKRALEERHEREIVEFDTSVEEANEHKTLLDLFSQDTFESDIFQELSTDEI